MDGERDHILYTLHPGKYRILRRAQENVVMMPTPCWRPEPLCFGTIFLERGIPPPLLEDTPYQMPRQLLNFDIIVEEEVSELILLKHA